MIATGTYSADREIKSSLSNILFLIIDDVGMDQMTSFGYGGITAAAMPNIDKIAKAGIRFRNNWTMPACSPSRAVFFEGRFPMRNNIFGALGPKDLANSMVSPFDITIPKLLKQKNYQNALFGKFHLGLQGNNPYGYSMVNVLGWDYFYGWLDETGDPSSIDVTAGGVGGAGGNGNIYTCGYVPGKDHPGGYDSGACYTPDSLCTYLETTAQTNPAGRICLDSGGIFDPDKKCSRLGTAIPKNIDFKLFNAHYVSPLFINNQSIPATDLRSRTFRGVAPVTAAINWIKGRPKGKPWMASISFATDHTPLQQAPYALLPNSAGIDTNGLDCSNSSSWPILSNQMIEAMDTEIGRLLIETKLARRNSDNSIDYNPEQTDTMIILVGDNGTFGNVVKLPFDPTRAKGTSYQTGVWTPLVVAGPLVIKPDRNVEAMTNIADIYQFFGEIAGINVHKEVPWTIDSKPLMPYVKNPAQPSIRSWNFNQIDLNLQADGAINGPCVMSGGASCSTIPVSQSVCEDNGGVWWGEGAIGTVESGGPVPLIHCCDVNIWLTRFSPDTPLPSILPQASVALRNTNYKIVHTYTKNYDANTNLCVDTKTDELYKINQDIPIPKIDKSGDDLLVNGFKAMTSVEKLNYLALNKKLKELQNSNVQCDGDGNLDGIVNQKDLDEWLKFSKLNGGHSSWYDFDLDGLTSLSDKAIIETNMGNTCK